MTNFQKVQIGQKFHTGKSKGIGIMSDKTMYMVYKKISKSEAIVKEQIGYGNNRSVGDVQSFSGNTVVWTI